MTIRYNIWGGLSFNYQICDNFDKTIYFILIYLFQSMRSWIWFFRLLSRGNNIFTLTLYIFLTFQYQRISVVSVLRYKRYFLFSYIPLTESTTFLKWLPLSGRSFIKVKIEHILIWYIRTFVPVFARHRFVYLL